MGLDSLFRQPVRGQEGRKDRALCLRTVAFLGQRRNQVKQPLFCSQSHSESLGDLPEGPNRPAQGYSQGVVGGAVAPGGKSQEGSVAQG